RLAPCRNDLVDHLLRRFGVHVVDDDLRAASSQEQGMLASEARTSARDDCHPPSQIDHAMLPECCLAYGTISVPAPCSVNSSSRTECGVLPLRMTTPSTPRSMASMQVSTLGIMPPEIVPSAISARASATVSSSISFLSLSRTPGTSVRKRRREALSAPAMAPAKVSALML